MTPFGCGMTRLEPVANRIETWRRCGRIHFRRRFRVSRRPSTLVKSSAIIDSSNARCPKSALIASAMAVELSTRMRSSLSRFARRSS